MATVREQALEKQLEHMSDRLRTILQERRNLSERVMPIQQFEARVEDLANQIDQFLRDNRG